MPHGSYTSLHRDSATVTTVLFQHTRNTTEVVTARKYRLIREQVQGQPPKPTHVLAVAAYPSQSGSNVLDLTDN